MKKKYIYTYDFHRVRLSIKIFQRIVINPSEGDSKYERRINEPKRDFEGIQKKKPLLTTIGNICSHRTMNGFLLVAPTAFPTCANASIMHERMNPIR